MDPTPGIQKFQIPADSDTEHHQNKLYGILDVIS